MPINRMSCFDHVMITKVLLMIGGRIDMMTKDVHPGGGFRLSWRNNIA